MLRPQGTAFLKTIVNSDFSLLNQESINFDNNAVHACIGTKKKKNYVQLNLLTLNTSLKQLLRCLQFIKQHYSSALHIYVKDLYLHKFLNKLLFKINTKTQVCVKNSLRELTEIQVQRDLVLLLDSDSIGCASIKKFFAYNFFLLAKINASTEQSTAGAYKIYNDIKELKKILFLVILLKRTLRPTARRIKRRSVQQSNWSLKKFKLLKEKIAVSTPLTLKTRQIEPRKLTGIASKKVSRQNISKVGSAKKLSEQTLTLLKKKTAVNKPLTLKTRQIEPRKLKVIDIKKDSRQNISKVNRLKKSLLQIDKVKKPKSLRKISLLRNNAVVAFVTIKTVALNTKPKIIIQKKEPKRLRARTIRKQVRQRKSARVQVWLLWRLIVRLVHRMHFQFFVRRAKARFSRKRSNYLWKSFVIAFRQKHKKYFLPPKKKPVRGVQTTVRAYSKKVG